MKTIRINNKDYKLRNSIRCLFIFEQITKKAFKIETLLDNYIFFYSMILANNKDCSLKWDEFIDAIDNDPNIFLEMSEIITEEQKKNELFADGDEKGGDEKKS